MFYKYTVKYYNEYTDEEMTDQGVVLADDFGTAASRVSEEYSSGVYEVTVREMAVEKNSYCLNKEDIDYAFSHDE